MWGESRRGEGLGAEPGRCPTLLEKHSHCAWCRLCPAPSQAHLNSSENLLESGSLVSPRGQQLSSSLEVLDVLTVHLQEGGQFLDHIPDAGSG